MHTYPSDACFSTLSLHQQKTVETFLAGGCIPHLKKHARQIGS